MAGERVILQPAVRGESDLVIKETMPDGGMYVFKSFGLGLTTEVNEEAKRYSERQFGKARHVYLAFDKFAGMAPRWKQPTTEEETLVLGQVGKGDRNFVVGIAGMTFIEGVRLTDLRTPIPPQHIKPLLLNAVEQVKFIYTNTHRDDKAELPWYHGDISDIQLVISPKMGGCLIDWDAIDAGVPEYVPPPMLLGKFSGDLLENTGFNVEYLKSYFRRDTEDMLPLDPYAQDLYGLGILVCRMVLGLDQFEELRKKTGGIIDPNEAELILKRQNGVESRRLVDFVNFSVSCGYQFPENPVVAIGQALQILQG